MQVLILNGGSSSLKYHLFEMNNRATILSGVVSNIGLAESSHQYTNGAGETKVEDLEVADHDQALTSIFNQLSQIEGAGVDKVEVVGHRVVHGGTHFSSPVIIDDSVEEIIEGYTRLAPLHNPANLSIIRTARKRLSTPTHIAIFDTAFHHSIPDFASAYGIPHELAEENDLRRYGFHGNSHEYIALRASQFLERPLRRLKLISCHLGNGASVCAIDRGRSVDTSMGFTPLEGLVMGTRCGDIDPALLTYLAREKDLSLDEIENILNTKSGLLGISGVSSNMKVVEQAAAQGDLRALLAIKLFCYRVKKYIGSYMLALGWVNAIVFTGGIGENSRGIRLRILQNTEKIGMGIDETRNQRCKVDAAHPVMDISARSSHTHVLVISTNEELMMARKCLEAIEHERTMHATAIEGVRQIPIGISAHHVHLSREDVDVLFGTGYQLIPDKDLSQHGQSACKERVDLIGPRGNVEGVRILGPERALSQVEISRTEEFKLGVDAPVRESGDLEGTPPITLSGPEGTVTLDKGLICAKRHIHMSPDDAAQFGVTNGDEVMVRVSSEGRELIFGDVMVRVNESFALEMHIDTDEANAAELSAPAFCTLVSLQPANIIHPWKEDCLEDEVSVA